MNQTITITQSPVATRQQVETKTLQNKLSGETYTIQVLAVYDTYETETGWIEIRRVVANDRTPEGRAEIAAHIENTNPQEEPKMTIHYHGTDTNAGGVVNERYSGFAGDAHTTVRRATHPDGNVSHIIHQYNDYGERNSVHHMTDLGKMVTATVEEFRK